MPTPLLLWMAVRDTVFHITSKVLRVQDSPQQATCFPSDVLAGALRNEQNTVAVNLATEAHPWSSTNKAKLKLQHDKECQVHPIHELSYPGSPRLAAGWPSHYDTHVNELFLG